MLGILLLALLVPPSFLVSSQSIKCCDVGYLVDLDSLSCVPDKDSLHQGDIDKPFATCFQDANSTRSIGNDSLVDATTIILASCTDYQKNGSIVHLQCSSLTKEAPDSNMTCDSVFRRIHIYGATMIVFANIVYLIIYLIVDLMYMLIPGTRRRAYDKAVFSFTSSQAALSVIVIIIGYSMLCHRQYSKLTTTFLGIGLQVFTVSGVLWLLVISLDVSSTITKFRWAPSSGAKGRDEDHKFRVYLIWVTIGTMVPVTISTTLAFSPLPEDHWAKPNFDNMAEINYKVISQVIAVPILVGVASNVLFFYTTHRMISIQKSTSIVNENRKKSVKKKYIMYLQLYLFMDAPYITGALGAIYENLWIFKFVRTIQPILLVYAVLPRNIVGDLVCCKKKKKGRRDKDEQVQNKNNELAAKP